MQYEENEATAAVATESFEQSETVDNNVVEISGDQSNGDEASNTFFATPAPELVLPPTRKHTGSVSSVRTMLSAQKGTPGIEITLHSDSNGKDYTKTIWVLEAYRQNPNLDPETLRGLPAPEGKTQTPFERYGRTIQNKKGSGELQELITVGTEVGRVFKRYATFEALGEVLNTALSGAPVFFTSRPKESETGFTMEIGRIYPNTYDWNKIKAEAADGSN